jgi:hypothetical protein
MKTLFVLAIALAVLTSSAAHAHKRSTAKPAASAGQTMLNQIVENVSIDAGWKWNSPSSCGDEREFFVGASTRVPLYERLGAFGSWDRAFTQEPTWEARAGLYITPFSR